MEAQIPQDLRADTKVMEAHGRRRVGRHSLTVGHGAVTRDAIREQLLSSLRPQIQEYSRALLRHTLETPRESGAGLKEVETEDIRDDI
ncbi:MAG: hypothetical protein CL940_07990 [Deltaproteobacteria bacterium]|nr:hypothetical protein [Deltaproteobacteria bacterium]